MDIAMKNITRKIQIVTALIIPLLLAACIGVRIENNVANPERYFTQAYRQIENIHKLFPHREGRCHSLHVLVYEKDEKKLIQVSTPYWMVKTCLELGMRAAEENDDFDWREKYDIDWQVLTDLEKIGRGLLVDINDEASRVLIWLE